MGTSSLCVGQESIHPLVHLFSTYLPSPYSVLGTVSGSGDSVGMRIVLYGPGAEKGSSPGIEQSPSQGLFQPSPPQLIVCLLID